MHLTNMSPKTSILVFVTSVYLSLIQQLPHKKGFVVTCVPGVCLGRDGLHPCEDGRSTQPQLWSLSQPQPQS